MVSKGTAKSFQDEADVSLTDIEENTALLAKREAELKAQQVAAKEQCRRGRGGGWSKCGQGGSVWFSVL